MTEEKAETVSNADVDAAEQRASDNTRAVTETQWEHVTLDEPIRRGGKTIKTINLRKPKSGELRRLSLADLVRMEVDALTTVIPRISDPVLTAPEAQGMDPADLMQCGTKIAGFFLTKAARAETAE
tara:strand:- start:467 stop:844 length:378 start_codon:yes stop_codon:yes gene_type:complete